jgi:hypothetical protein
VSLPCPNIRLTLPIVVVGVSDLERAALGGARSAFCFCTCLAVGAIVEAEEEVSWGGVGRAPETVENGATAAEVAAGVPGLDTGVPGVGVIHEAGCGAGMGIDGRGVVGEIVD